MRLRVPDSIKDMLGVKYLDWAERLPKSNKGIIHTLQHIREWQKENAERGYVRTRPPQGAVLDYPYFRLFEVFQIEDFEQLREGLVQLLPGLEDSLSRQMNFTTDFTDFAGTISGGGWWNLGTIARTRNRLYVNTFRKMPELPAEIDYVELELHKILPSILVVTVDVHLNDSVVESLIQLQNRRYLPRVRFRRLVPRGSVAGGYSRGDAEAIMRNEILKWLARLRGDVEACIKPFLNGYFMQRSSNKLARLPAIEVFALRGAPEEKDAFNEWSNSSRAWLDSLGFAPRLYNTFRSDKYIFIWAGDEEASIRIPYRLVLRDSEPESNQTDNLREHEKGEIFNHTKDTLGAVIPSIALIELLESTQRKIEKIRQDVFSRMKPSSFLRYRLGSYINTNIAAQRESMLLERISLEFEQNKNWIQRDMEELADFELERAPGEEKQKNLRDISLESITFRIELLRKHLTLATTSFSQYSTTQNLEAMYRLQWSIFLLTLLVTFATIVQIVGWPNVQRISADLAELLTKLLLR